MSEPPSSRAERVYAGRTPDQRRGDRRAAVLDAAIELYGTRGVRHTSERALISRSKVAKRYLDAEFDGADSILVAVHQQLREDLEAAVLPQLVDVPDDGLLVATVHAYVQAMTADPRVARIMLVEVYGVSDRVEAARQAMVDEFVSLLVEVHPEARRTHAADPAFARRLAVALIAGLYDLLYRWTRVPDARELDDLVATWILLCDRAWATAPAPACGGGDPTS